MFWINTRWIITAWTIVANNYALGNGSVMQFPANPMRSCSLAQFTTNDNTMSALRDCAYPDPTGISFLHMLPKVILDGQMASTFLITLWATVLGLPLAKPVFACCKFVLALPTGAQHAASAIYQYGRLVIQLISVSSHMSSPKKKPFAGFQVQVSSKHLSTTKGKDKHTVNMPGLTNMCLLDKVIISQKEVYD